MKVYDLIPIDHRKSFYNKAKVVIADNGEEYLYSYNTAVLKRCKDGELKRLYDGWSMTTGRHIKAFCGLSKAEFMALQIV